MCTHIVEQCALSGSVRGAGGWFALREAAVAYDHPVHAREEHAILLDLSDERAGISQRVPVELSLGAARALAETLLAAIERAEAFEAGVRPDRNS